MNKRIKELVDQAGFIRFSPEEDPQTPIDWASDYTLELEKFSELIVRECVTRIKGCHLAEYATQDEFELGYKKAIDKAISQVLLHLGIDE